MTIFPFVVLMGMLSFIYLLSLRRKEYRVKLQISFFSVMLLAAIDRTLASIEINESHKREAAYQASKLNPIESVLNHPEGIRLVQDYLSKVDNAGIARTSSSSVH